jgi:hypothetical protein
MKKIVAIGLCIPERRGIRVPVKMQTGQTGSFPQIQQDPAIEFLQKLRTHPQNRKKLLEKKFIDKFTTAVSALEYPIKDINYIIYITMSLIILTEDPLLPPQLSPAIPALTKAFISLASHYTLTTQERALLQHTTLALANLAQNPEARTQILATDGVIQALTEFVINLTPEYSTLTPHNKNLLQYIILALANLAQDQTARTQILATDEIIQTLTEFVINLASKDRTLTTQQITLLQDITLALANLTQNQRARTQILATDGVIQALTTFVTKLNSHRALTTQQTDILYHTTIIIARLAATTEGQQILARNKAVSTLTKLFTRLASQDLLTTEQTDILYYATLIIESLAQEPDAQKQIRDTKEAIDALNKWATLKNRDSLPQAESTISHVAAATLKILSENSDA